MEVAGRREPVVPLPRLPTARPRLGASSAWGPLVRRASGATVHPGSAVFLGRVPTLLSLLPQKLTLALGAKQRTRTLSLRNSCSKSSRIAQGVQLSAL